MSFSTALAAKHGRTVRDDFITYPDRLGQTVRPDLAGQKEWELTGGNGGGMYATGIGSALTGRPVDLLIIDDPLKDREEADSIRYRDRAWDWWTSVGSARLAPGAPVVLILTRWHEDDLAGRLLAAEDGHRWQVINIPAQADHNVDKGETDPLGRQPGEFMLSARRRTQQQWEARKITAGARDWAALYQGRPSPEGGDIFRRDWWQRYDQPLWTVNDDGTCTVPGNGTLLVSWDMTFKDTSASDYVVGQVWLHRGPDAYLLDQIRRRMSFSATLEAFKGQVAKWPQASAKLVEDKANGTAILDTLRKSIPGLVPITPHESKTARAQAISPFIQASNVHLPSAKIAPWITEFIEEAAIFPNGSHDDQVDGMTQALQRIYLGKTGQGSMWMEYLTKRKAAQEGAH